MRINRMHKGNYGKVRAFFDVEVIEGFTVKGFKIVDGDNGLFVSYPSTKQKEQYLDQVWLSNNLKEELTELGINQYKTNN